MLDDLRDHDATPDEQERAWMSIDLTAIALRLVVLASLAVAIGLGAAQIVAPNMSGPVAAAER
jgi:hypothetical protein